MKRIVIAFTFISVFMLLIQCDKTGGVNFLSLREEIQLGRQLDSTVNADYNVLDRSGNTDAYEYLETMMNDILESPEILYRDELEWKITIIEDDGVLNAFAAPGGYLYFYTGIMKYLDNASYLSGVMAHEIAHTDRRHTGKMLTKYYTFALILDIILGRDKSQLETIAVELALGIGQLQFSKDHEYEADEYSVRYNANNTKYNPRGISGFFIQLDEDGMTKETFEFLSTHPNPGNRIEAINEVWNSLGQPSGGEYADEYNNFKNILP